MQLIGITTNKDVEILKGIGTENLTVILKMDEKKWSIYIQVFNTENMYYIERQRGGTRKFAHLETALLYAFKKIPEVNKYVIHIDDKILIANITS